MPRIVDDDMRFRVSDDVEIVLAEMLGDDARNERLDFGDRQRLDVLIDAHGASGGTGAAPDDEHALRRLGNERREMAEHALQAHVLRLARRLHLPGVVIVHHLAET